MWWLYAKSYQKFKFFIIYLKAKQGIIQFYFRNDRARAI